eukprot:CAMPEP_0185037048 /NCGR_PEP_ID=MMETSP1103-20130426/30932_1 /TAXON_ID=36769 /ORGANISM="Paraphysomonas bandaiensis, Strain Caron Lab Isolate" /LENGTH=623 /DNA_ID=CAMNT_0027574845 /DNA_START=133 /DNA_END=2004 /DNA_ORIENTATION=-
MALTRDTYRANRAPSSSSPSPAFASISASSIHSQRPKSAGCKSHVHDALRQMRNCKRIPQSKSCFVPQQHRDDIFPKPIPMSTMEALRKQAIKNRRERVYEEKANAILASKLGSGVKREIDPALIAQIVDDIDTEKANKLQRKRSRHVKRFRERTSATHSENQEYEDIARISTIDGLDSTELAELSFVHSLHGEIHDNTSDDDWARPRRNEIDAKRAPPSQRRGSAMHVSMSNKEIRRKRDEIQRQEKERKLQLIEEKKAKKIKFKLNREAAMERRQRQMIWLHIVSHMSRASVLHLSAADLLSYRAQMRLKALRNCSATRIARWFKEYKSRALLKRHIKYISVYKMVSCMLWAKRELRQRRAATSILTHFIKSAVSVNTRATQMYTFRRNITMVQKWCRGYLVCTRARLKLLCLALDKAVVARRIVRRKQLRRDEIESVRATMQTRMYGETVKHVERMRCNIRNLLTMKKRRVNMKGLRDASQSGVFSQSEESVAEDPVYMKHAKAILANERFKYCTMASCRWEQLQKAAKPTLNKSDARRYLRMPTAELRIAAEDPHKHLFGIPFFLLTDGGLELVQYAARDIVMMEEQEARRLQQQERNEQREAELSRRRKSYRRPSAMK